MAKKPAPAPKPPKWSFDLDRCPLDKNVRLLAEQGEVIGQAVTVEEDTTLWDPPTAIHNRSDRWFMSGGQFLVPAPTAWAPL